MRRDFSFYSALQWSSYVCSIYKTYGNPVSVRFPLFQHQHSTNVGCFWAFHCLCKLFRLTAFQTGPVRDSNCIHNIAQNVQNSSLRLGLYPSPRRGSLWRSPRPPSRRVWQDKLPTLSTVTSRPVPSLKKIYGLPIDHDASAINSNTTRSDIAQTRGNFVENCNEHNNEVWTGFNTPSCAFCMGYEV